MQQPKSLFRLFLRSYAITVVWLMFAVAAFAGLLRELYNAAVPVPETTAAATALTSWQLGLCGAFALAVAGTLWSGISLYRRLSRAVRGDIKSIARMFHDVRHNAIRPSYPMELKEFGAIFQYLRDSGRKLVEERQKMKDMGLLDHLSQLSNRRHFEMRLKELYEAAKTNGQSSVLIIDMDYFKQVNDRHGHDAGDALIVGFARELRKRVRQTDVLARLGGDEFCLIYPYTPLERAVMLVERLRRELPREISLIKGIVHQLRWTGGLSVMTDADTKFDDVLWRADQALVRAKEAGRNVTKVYDPKKGLEEKPRIMHC